MNKIYVLDACALIAVQNNEKGADIVQAVMDQTARGEVVTYMNIFNLLEVYYGDYRSYGKEFADNIVQFTLSSKVKIVTEVGFDILYVAGRLKGTYQVSIADSVALAQTMVVGGILLTKDHHEFDIIERNEPINILWIQ